jgi:hypothetical protein
MFFSCEKDNIISDGLIGNNNSSNGNSEPEVAELALEVDCSEGQITSWYTSGFYIETDATFGNCTISENTATFTPSSVEFDGTDTCEIRDDTYCMPRRIEIEFDYSDPDNPSCTIINTEDAFC